MYPVNAKELFTNDTKEMIAVKSTEWLRKYSAKQLSKMFDVSIRTSRGWREGNLPQNKHLIKMAERWGQDFIEEIFSPITQVEITDDHRLECVSHHVSALQKTKIVISLFIVMISTFGAILDGEPVRRAPRPTVQRVRSRKD